MRLQVSLLACLAFAGQNALAQLTSGEILGAVQDASGAAIADARVVVHNLDTNSAKEILTALDGRFRVPQLPVGNYEVTVEKSGFAKYVQRPIVLRLNQDADLQIKLQVAGVAETVNVTGDAPLLPASELLSNKL